VGAHAPVSLIVRGPLRREDLDGLAVRACAVLRDVPGVVVPCRVVDVEADAVAVDALAQLQAAARRNGRRIVLLDVSDDLRELIAWMGLGDVLPIRS
jgi:anti-anti-sigma regulatory factor